MTTEIFESLEMKEKRIVQELAAAQHALSEAIPEVLFGILSHRVSIDQNLEFVKRAVRDVEKLLDARVVS